MAAGSTAAILIRYPDGSIEIKDRKKIIIISGGENISSLEVEEVLHRRVSGFCRRPPPENQQCILREQVKAVD